jgi:Lon protease-like protein
MNPELIDSHLESLPLFPLPGVVLFPNTILPLHIFELRYRQMVKDVRESKGPIAIAHIDPTAPPPARGEAPIIHPIAGVGFLRRVEPLEDGRFLIELKGAARVRVLEELPPETPYQRVRAELLPEKAPDLLARQQVDVLRGMLMSIDGSHDFSRRLHALLTQSDCPSVISDVAANLLFQDSELRQNLLEELDPRARLIHIIESLTQYIAPVAKHFSHLN